MALSKAEIAATYPLPVYNYRVEINGEAIGFSEVTGLSVNHETTTYVESALSGGRPRRLYMPGQLNATKITMKKGVVSGVSVQVLFDWINSIQLNRIDKKDIYVRLCNEEGTAVISWKVVNAFPTKLDAPSFTASSNDVAVESMELMADTVLAEQN